LGIRFRLLAQFLKALELRRGHHFHGPGDLLGVFNTADPAFECS